jgi:hypothetical protein
MSVDAMGGGLTWGMMSRDRGNGGDGDVRSGHKVVRNCSLVTGEGGLQGGPVGRRDDWHGTRSCWLYGRGGGLWELGR